MDIRFCDEYLISYRVTFNAARHVELCKDTVDVVEEGNLCGYRYEVDVCCRHKYLLPIIDFSFLKSKFAEVIRNCFDHGFIIAYDDILINKIFDKRRLAEILKVTDFHHGAYWHGMSHFGKTTILPYPPISEYLARFFFELMGEFKEVKLSEYICLERVRVWETPNWYSEYPANN
jgi:hypothetical protein